MWHGERNTAEGEDTDASDMCQYDGRSEYTEEENRCGKSAISRCVSVGATNTMCVWVFIIKLGQGIEAGRCVLYVGCRSAKPAYSISYIDFNHFVLCVTHKRSIDHLKILFLHFDQPICGTKCTLWSFSPWELLQSNDVTDGFSFCLYRERTRGHTCTFLLPFHTFLLTDSWWWSVLMCGNVLQQKWRRRQPVKHGC